MICVAAFDTFHDEDSVGMYQLKKIAFVFALHMHKTRK